jgi:hypothetical protein
MDINSREERSLETKVAPNSKYKPLQMTDESVYDMARHWYTVEEVAARFHVSEVTLLQHHGDAFRQGKAEGFQKPRMLLNKILSDFAGTDGDGVNFARPDVPVHNLLKAIELHAKKYEGLGSKQTIVHEGKMSYDAVESKPVIIEKPAEE